jgi:outer membrane protein
MPAPPPIPPAAPAASAALAADSATIGATQGLSLTDVVDLALRNNPATRESWAHARAVSDVYGAARGALFPTVDGQVALARSKGSTVAGGTGTNIGGVPLGTTGNGTGGTGGTSGGSGTTRTQIAPSLSLSYLVFDLGGRAGGIEAAKQRAIEANLAHNSTVRDVVLEAESSLFSFIATRALRDAQIEAVGESEADLAAAQERFRVGVATVQEVLQTRTALSQTQLQLETLEASVSNAHGILAVAMGLQANTRYDIPNVPVGDSVSDVCASVDTLINRAIVTRPDLAGTRAEAAALAAEVRVARAAGYPALTLNSNASYVRSNQGTAGPNYTISLGVRIPVFNGFSRQYDVRTAREDYEAGLARVESMQQQITLQVLTAYNALDAATKRVRTSSDLVRNAQESANVAIGRYQAGVGTIIDVLLARTALANARASAIQARWEWRTALAQLAHDTGALDAHGQPNLQLSGPPGNIRR